MHVWHWLPPTTGEQWEKTSGEMVKYFTFTNSPIQSPRHPYHWIKSPHRAVKIDFSFSSSFPHFVFYRYLLVVAKKRQENEHGQFSILFGSRLRSSNWLEYYPLESSPILYRQYLEVLLIELISIKSTSVLVPSSTDTKSCWCRGMDGRRRNFECFTTSSGSRKNYPEPQSLVHLHFRRKPDSFWTTH